MPWSLKHTQNKCEQRRGEINKKQMTESQGDFCVGYECFSCNNDVTSPKSGKKVLSVWDALLYRSDIDIS